MNKPFRLFRAATCVVVNAPRIKGIRATRIASEEGAYHPFVCPYCDATHPKKLGKYCPIHDKPLWVRHASGRNPLQTSCLVCGLARCTHPPYGGECGLKRYKGVVL